MNDGPALSIIVPTLDEAEYLPALLTDVQSLEAEVIVVDGGSSDGTVALARSAGARTLQADAGRGSQLRAGASEARGRWLLFVHADCRLDGAARTALVAFLATAGEEEYAHFDFALDGAGFIHRFIEFGQDIRERWLGLVYGDQGLVVSRSLYAAVGGYPDWPVMEDVGILRRLASRGRRVPLPATLISSDRRYAEEGGLRRWLRNVMVMTLFRLGVPPRQLARWYRPRRSGRHPTHEPEAGGRRVVGVFAKAPVPGRVKTRLAADIGDRRATEIYRGLGRRTVDALRGGDYRLVVFGTPADSASLESIGAWLGPEGTEIHPQPEGDLGHRLATAVDGALRRAEAIVIVGTDIPGIDRKTVSEAFSLLREHDVVLGPATDGGYYLVGLTRSCPDLFAGIDWSTSRVLDQTLDRIATKGLTVAFTEAKSDVDTVEDLSDAVGAGTAGGA